MTIDGVILGDWLVKVGTSRAWAGLHRGYKTKIPVFSGEVLMEWKYITRRALL